MNSFRKVALKIVAVGATANLMVANALASSPSGYLGGITGAGGGGNLLDFIRRTLSLIIGLAGLVAVGFLVYSGIQYIMAGGDEGKVEKATKGITNAVIGLVICFIAVLIVNFVLSQVLKV